MEIDPRLRGDDKSGKVHLHDNDSTHDFHLPVGKGTIDFGFLFEFLEERNKRPILTLEPHKKEHLLETLQGLIKVLPPSFIHSI